MVHRGQKLKAYPHLIAFPTIFSQWTRGAWQWGGLSKGVSCRVVKVGRNQVKASRTTKDAEQQGLLSTQNTPQYAQSLTPFL